MKKKNVLIRLKQNISRLFKKKFALWPKLFVKFTPNSQKVWSSEMSFSSKFPNLQSIFQIFHTFHSSGFIFSLKHALQQVKQIDTYVYNVWDTIEFSLLHTVVLFQLGVALQPFIMWLTRNVLAEASSEWALYSLNMGFKSGTEIYVKTEQVLKCNYNSAYPNFHHRCFDNMSFARENTKVIYCSNLSEINQKVSLDFMRLVCLPGICWSHRTMWHVRGFTCHAFTHNARDFTYNGKIRSPDSKGWYIRNYDTPFSKSR